MDLPITGPDHLSVKVADYSSTSVTGGRKHRQSVEPEHLKESDLSWAHWHKRNDVSMNGGVFGRCRAEI